MNPYFGDLEKIFIPCTEKRAYFLALAKARIRNPNNEASSQYKKQHETDHLSKQTSPSIFQDVFKAQQQAGGGDHALSLAFFELANVAHIWIVSLK